MSITPAHAGKSFRNGLNVRVHEDHPRTRGEKQDFRPKLFIIKGSPPHTRGKVTPLTLRIFEARITPAHAGKRITQGLSLWIYGDHPRTRGEKQTPLPPLLPASGSPPHTRGKVYLFIPVIQETRITPAHAGKSEQDLLHDPPEQDHPRTRGEKFPQWAERPRP